MDDSKLKFGVGVLVIAAIGIGVILVFLFGAVPRVLTGEYQILVAFPSAEGIGANTKVLLRGVDVGRVIDKRLREDDVLLTLGIDTKYQANLTHEYIPRIGTGSFITGDARLEFVKATEDELLAIHQDRLPEVRLQSYTDDQYLDFGAKSSSTFDVLFNMEDELRLTLESVRNASESLSKVGTSVEGLVAEAKGVVGQVDTELDGVAEEARGALEEFQGVMREVRELIGDPELRESLKLALSELPEVLSEAQTTLQSTQKTFESFERVGERFERVGQAAEKTVNNVDLTVDSVRDAVQSVERGFKSAEQTIQNIEKITEPIAENSDELVRQVLMSLTGLDRSLHELETFGKALNNSDGTVRRLLEDDAIYWQIRRTVENVEQATAKLRPILDDVRIFTDKVARDPRELGIRGAIGRRPSGLGIK